MDEGLKLLVVIIIRIFRYNIKDSNLDVYKEDVDYFLFTQRGDDIPNGIEIYNLEMLKHNDFRRLLNYFTYTVERG